MRHPEYCTHKVVTNCRECSLSSYGRDCRNNPIPEEPVRVTLRLPRSVWRQANAHLIALDTAEDRRHSLNGLLVELIQRGLASVAQEPGWSEAIASAKGGGKK